METPSVAPNTLPTISRRSTAAGTNGSATTSEAGSHATPATAAGSKVVRHDGSDRYATMAAAVEAAFEKSDWVIVASGESYPDALSAVALAGAHDAPVILTARNSLPSQAVAQIRRLGATHAIIVGGESSVTRAVEDALKGIVGDVSRVTGADRTATSVAALRALRSAKSTSDTLIVASGSTFADALSAGPWAWRTSSPIVLTDSRGMLSDEAVSAIKADGHFRRVLLVGGKDAVSDAIRNQLKGDLAYIRTGGADRYDTSLEMAKFATSNGLDWQSPMIATGDDFADALAGAAPAGKLGSPLLLIGPHDEGAVSELARHTTDLRRAHVLGGISAVPTSVEDALKAALS